MKNTIIDLNDANEPLMFSNSILGNFIFDTYFIELKTKLSSLTNSNKQSELLHTTQIVDPHYTILDDCTKVDSNSCKNLVSSSSNFLLELTVPYI